MVGTTRALARFLVETDYASLPDNVRAEGPRAFINWLGCLYGGLNDVTTATAYKALGGFMGRGMNTIIGRASNVDPVNATFFNTLSSCTHAYDDTHLITIAHPSGPAAAAALMAAEATGASGRDMLAAMLMGIEIQCRVANMIARPPAKTSVGFYMTGLTGALGAAAAAGMLLGLDEQRMTWALGIASAQGAGFRETHATMSNGLMRAQAARNGMTAALLARDGFTCSETAIEGSKGFASVYGQPADVAAATEGLGTHFELLNNTYKPYPCGIVAHPVIDLCRDIIETYPDDEIERIDLSVHPWAIKLTGVKAPHDVEDARVSLYHWAAAMLVRRRAGLVEGDNECVSDPAIVAMRERIHATAAEGIEPDAARGTVRLRDGRTADFVVEAARGSTRRPMSNDDLTQKFQGQAFDVLGESKTKSVADACWALAVEADANARLMKLIL